MPLLELQPYMQLDALLQGLSTLLQPLLGLQLVARQPVAAEVVSSGVRVLAVVHEQEGLLGTVYCELGGGYGARMLRFTRPHAGAGTGAKAVAEALAGAEDRGSSAAAPASRCAAGEAAQQRQPLWADECRLSAEASAALAAASMDLPVVSIGLGGTPNEAGLLGPSGLWELMHEMGHALHLLLSAR